MSWSDNLSFLVQGPRFCQQLLPASPLYECLYAALVCGVSLPDGLNKQLFLDSGLIHLMVVSGAHLVFLESALAKFPPLVRLPILGGYCWFTGFGAPVVKAFLRRVCELKLNARGWSTLQSEAMAVIVALIIVPEWLFSRSFQMSWMCALALASPPRWRGLHLDQAFKVFVFLFLFCGASPITILWNALVAPLVGLILFPLCLLVLPLPFLVSAVDRLWDIFLSGLHWGPAGTPQTWFLATRDLIWLPPITHLALLYGEVRWRRAFGFASR